MLKMTWIAGKNSLLLRRFNYRHKFKSPDQMIRGFLLKEALYPAIAKLLLWLLVL
jgi:hypothetical protein